jgi:hypothetical protein
MICFSIVLSLVLTSGKIQPSHFCATACVGPCLSGQRCTCDGIHCPVNIDAPGRGLVRITLDNDRLPKRKTTCPDRPLVCGRTFRRTSTGGEYCNDPECGFCEDDQQDNGNVRGDWSEPCHDGTHRQ